MEVPAPNLRFMSTKSFSGIKANLNVLNYLINPAIMHAGPRSHIFSGPCHTYHGFAGLHEIHSIPFIMYMYPDPDGKSFKQHLSEIRNGIHMVQVKSCTSKLTSYPEALKQLRNYLH